MAGRRDTEMVAVSGAVVRKKAMAVQANLKNVPEGQKCSIQHIL
jgi:hypothetical protein